MRLLVLSLAGLVLIGGGSAGAYFYFKQSAEASVGATTDHKAAADTHGKKSSGHGEAKTEFVELDPLILPIIDEGGVSQVISLVVVIEVADKEMAAEVTRLAPRLKDAYIQEMYGVLNRQSALNNGVLQVGPIKERLNAITQTVLGGEVAQEVLLQVVSQRPV